MSSILPASFEESDISKRNLIEQWILSNIDYTGLKKGLPVSFRANTSFYLTELPQLDLRRWPPNFEATVFAVLVDEDMKDDLLRAGLINWCPNVRPVVPLHVPRDGNCLLHSIATVIWGISDRSLTLRRLLQLVLDVDNGKRFYGRWVHNWQIQLSQLLDRTHLSRNLEDTKREWTDIGHCLDPVQFRSTAVPHRFLEAIHVYTLANILRRPIIILTDPTMRTFSGLSLQENDMGGIYLPLEWKWEHTCRTPVVLSYSHCHFSPLLFASSNQARAAGCLVPLVNRQLQQLPVRFLLQGESPEVGELLNKYLKIRETVMQIDGSIQNILCAELEAMKLPDELNMVKDYFELCLNRLHPVASMTSSQIPGSVRTVEREQLQRMWNNEYSLADPSLARNSEWGQNQIHIPPPSFTPRNSLMQQNASLNPPQHKKCVVPGCKYYGDPDLGMMCSHCFKNYSMKESRQMAARRTFQPVPTAPLSTMQTEEQQLQLSMMAERCHDGCGFRCSIHTYPYCHECAQKHQERAKAAIRLSETEMTTPGFVTGASTAASPAVLPSSGLPQEQQKNQNGSPLNDLSRSKGTSTGQTVMTSPSGEQCAQDMSPTQVLATGNLVAPLTPIDDRNDKLLFGSGQSPPVPAAQPGNVSPLSQTQALASQLASHVENWAEKPPMTRQEQSGPQPFASSSSLSQPQHQLLSPAILAQEQNVSSASGLTESQLAVVVTGIPADAPCSGEGCNEKAIMNNLCGKCYISQGMGCANPCNPTVQKLRNLNVYSTSSSAPASVGASIPSSPFTVETGPSPLLPSRQRASSVSQVTEIHAVPANNLSDVQNWVNKSGNIASHERRPASGLSSSQTSQPLGLPEKQETELPGNDLVASGLECYHAPRCIEEECQNTVQKEGELCEQCRSILRQFRQKQRSSMSVRESVPPGQQSCLTEGCRYFGFKENLNFCSSCYDKMFKKQLQEEMRHAHPANLQHHPPPEELRYTQSQSPNPRPQPYTQSQSSNPRPQPYTQSQSTNPHPQLYTQSQSTNLQPEPIAQLETVRTPQQFASFSPSLQGLPCTEPGCVMFGDPKQAGMCWTHYQQHLALTSTPVSRTAPLASQGLQYQRPAEPLTQSAPLARQYDKYTQQSERVNDPLRHSAPMMSLSNPVDKSLEGVLVTPTAGTLYNPEQGSLRTGERLPPPFPSVSAPPSSFPPFSQPGVGMTSVESSLNETYNRVVGRQVAKCLNPTCSNFGNPNKGGVCNNCALDESLARELIYGREEIG